MATKIKKPTIIEPTGNKPKIIKEFIGLINSNTENISIAQMESPPGWKEPGQTPDFDEYTIVLEGQLKVETIDYDVTRGQFSIWLRELNSMGFSG